MVRLDQDKKWDALLEQNRYREAVLQMEIRILEGHDIGAEWLKRIPDSYLSASPLLLLADGSAALYTGDLARARMVLEQSVKGHASLSLPLHLLVAMARLAEVYFRMGDYPLAETLLLFLYAENQHIPKAERPGEVVRVLGIGMRLLKDMYTEQTKPYLEAVQRFEEQGQKLPACLTIVDLVLQCGNVMSGEEWGELEWKLRSWTACHRQGPSLVSLFQALRLGQAGQWKEALKLLRTRSREGLPYYQSVSAEVLLLRALLHVEPEAGIYQMTKLAQYIEQYALDMELKHVLLQALEEGARRLGRVDECQNYSMDARAVARILRLPEHSDESNAENSLPVSPVAIHSPADGAWRLCCFGGLAFCRGGNEIRSIRWKRKKALELLVFLLLEPRSACSRERIADVLELGEDPHKSSQALYVIVHQLKRTLWLELGITDGVFVRDGVVVINEEAWEEHDVERYITLIRVADQLWVKDRELAAEIYRQACELYDELLPEIQYLDWLDQYREYLLEKQVSILTRLCNFSMENHSMESAEAFCREWIRLRPYQEEAYRQLIELLIGAGREKEARSWYDELARRLFTEFGDEPMAETRLLLEERKQ